MMILKIFYFILFYLLIGSKNSNADKAENILNGIIAITNTYAICPSFTK